MITRKASPQDLDQIMSIYAVARTYMQKNDNPTQWGDDYPKQSLIESDIEKGQSYVIEGDDSTIHGTFALIVGEDPTYKVIENGQWLNNDLYGTIHRVAADGKVKGIGRACFDYSKTLIDNLRCDTHHDNITMQQILVKNGFKECGVIYVQDGSPRIAYHWVK